MQIAALEARLPRVVEAFSPQLVFYQAGVDPLVSDRLGRLALSLEGLKQRNEMVYGLLRPLVAANTCGVVLTLGGGAISSCPTLLLPCSLIHLRVIAELLIIMFSRGD